MFVAPKTLSLNKTKEKHVFLFEFWLLIRTFGFAEGTFARQNKRKARFSFVLCSLIRTFVTWKRRKSLVVL
jgi:hypothetical protein